MSCSLKSRPSQDRCAERFEIAVASPVEIGVESRLLIFAFGPDPVIYAGAAQRNDALPPRQTLTPGRPRSRSTISFFSARRRSTGMRSGERSSDVIRMLSWRKPASTVSRFESVREEH